MFIITTSILRNLIDLIASIGIIRDRFIGVVSRYQRELQLQRIWEARLCILRNARLLACYLSDIAAEGLLPLLLAPCSLFLTRLRYPSLFLDIAILACFERIQAQLTSLIEALSQSQCAAKAVISMSLSHAERQKRTVWRLKMERINDCIILHHHSNVGI